MRAIIGAKLLASSIAQPAAKPFEIYDTRLPGFALRVQPSGVRSYYARFGRNRRISLGKVGELLPDEARGKCQKVLGNVAHGRHPLSGLFGPDGPTLGEFVKETFTRWAQANRPRSAANTLEKLHLHFGSLFAEPLSVITVERIESWKQRRLNSGRKPTTVLRDLFALSSVLSRAVKIVRGAGLRRSSARARPQCRESARARTARGSRSQLGSPTPGCVPKRLEHSIHARLPAGALSPIPGEYVSIDTQCDLLLARRHRQPTMRHCIRPLRE